MRNYILTTIRFNLREFIPEDAKGIYQLNLHPDILKFTTDPPFKDINEARNFLYEYDAYNVSGFGRWAIEEKQTGKFVGWSGLKFILEENEVDVGYRLLPEYWGKGIALETGIACCKYGIFKMGLKRIVARIHKQNFRSVRVAEKMNMKYEKDIIYDGLPWFNYVYQSSKNFIDNQTF